MGTCISYNKDYAEKNGSNKNSHISVIPIDNSSTNSKVSVSALSESNHIHLNFGFGLNADPQLIVNRAIDIACRMEQTAKEENGEETRKLLLLLKMLQTKIAQKSSTTNDDKLFHSRQSIIGMINSSDKKEKNIGEWLGDLLDREHHRKNVAKKRNSSLNIISPLHDSIKDILMPSLTMNQLSQLALINSWDEFDIFQLAAMCNGKPLAIITYYTIKQLGLMKDLCIDAEKLCRFLNEIEEQYLTTIPFHTNIHAADVVQAQYYWLTGTKLGNMLTAMDKLICLISAACHDVAHPGYNETFNIEIGSELALRYNDSVVLENHHLTTSFKTLNKDECNWQSLWLTPEKKEFRAGMISCIFATDISNHHKYLSDFHAQINCGSFEKRLDHVGRESLRNIAMKTADLSNPCRPTRLMLEWTKKLVEEFYRQGDEERRLGLEVTPIMDRNKLDLEKMQLGFIQVVVNPLYKAWEIISEKAGVPLNQLELNRQYWEQLNPETLKHPSLGVIEECQSDESQLEEKEEKELKKLIEF